MLNIEVRPWVVEWEGQTLTVVIDRGSKYAEQLIAWLIQYGNHKEWPCGTQVALYDAPMLTEGGYYMLSVRLPLTVSIIEAHQAVIDDLSKIVAVNDYA